MSEKKTIVQLTSALEGQRFTYSGEEAVQGRSVTSWALMSDGTVEPVIFCCARFVPALVHLKRHHPAPPGEQIHVGFSKDGIAEGR